MGSGVSLNSIDVPVSTNSTQSENSIIADPNDYMMALNSNNSGGVNGAPIYGANDLYTFDGGTTVSRNGTAKIRRIMLKK